MKTVKIKKSATIRIDQRTNNKKEQVIERLLFVSALITVLTTFMILAILVYESIGFFQEVSVFEFFTGTEWAPLFTPQKFGILPLITGTLLVTVIALIIAVPVGLGSAILLSEYAHSKVRNRIKPVLEILAGIPSVVYGYFALTFVTPLLRTFLPHLEVFNALSAGLVMGIMIVPMIASLSEDAMKAVSQSFREAAYALGSQKHHVIKRIVLPAAFPGIVSSFSLAFSRAIGETMIVSIAAGSTPNMSFNPFESIQTLTGYITQISLGEAPYGSLEYNTIFSVGLTLFIMVIIVNSVWLLIKRKYERKY